MESGGIVVRMTSIEDADVIEKMLKHLGLDQAYEVRNRAPPAGLFDHANNLF